MRPGENSTTPAGWMTSAIPCRAASPTAWSGKTRTATPPTACGRPERLLRDHRLPAAGALTERFRFSLPADAVGPLRVQATLDERRLAGYLTDLMSIYLGETMPAEATRVMGWDEARVGVH